MEEMDQISRYLSIESTCHAEQFFQLFGTAIEQPLQVLPLAVAIACHYCRAGRDSTLPSRGKSTRLDDGAQGFGAGPKGLVDIADVYIRYAQPELR
jgi:hypothetical protein